MFREAMPKGIPFGALIYILGKFSESHIKKYIKKYTPQMYDKIVGIAEGSQQPMHKMWLAHYIEILNMFPIIAYNKNPNKIADPTVEGTPLKDLAKESQYNASYDACSSFIVLKEASADGNEYLAHNYDFPEILRNYQMLRLEEPENGMRNLNMSQYPWACSHTGLNEAGVAITYNNGRAWRKDMDDFRTKGVPSTFLLQRVLENAENTDQAVKIILDCKHRTIGGHYCILDSEGNACIVETTASRYYIRKPERGVLAQTNHYIAIKDANIPDGIFWDVEGLKIHPQASPRERYRRIKELLDLNLGKIDMEKIKKILRDHNNKEPDDFTICTHGSSAGTLSSFIINPAKKEFWVTDTYPCISEYEKYTL